jgi:hypothetical protein
MNTTIAIDFASLSSVVGVIARTVRNGGTCRNVGIGLTALAILALAPVRAEASLHTMTTGTVLTSVAAAPGGGFWVQWDNFLFAEDANGAATYAKDGAPMFENVENKGSIAAIPGRNGYWVVSHTGRIFTRGDAPQLCDGYLSNCSGFPGIPVSWQYIVAAAATPTGNGLWAVGADGKLWVAGDAQSYGDVQSDSATPTGIAVTPSGKGYYIVMEDGGVYSFGDAVFFGSTGGKKPGGHDATGIALSMGDDGKVNGYWMVASDGGVFTFGSAPFWGSTGGNDDGSPVISIVSFPAPVLNGPPQRTRGYAWVNSNGQVSVVNGPFLPMPLPPQPGPGTPPPPDA